MESTIISGLGYIGPLFDLAYNILIFFSNLLGGNLGIGIIAFILSLRLITLPFSIKQMNAAKKNKEFQKKYKEIEEKYKGKDGDKIKEEKTKELATLQSEYLPAQLGGCLPTILQILFFFQVYWVIRNILEVGVSSFNEVRYGFIPELADGALELGFLGMNLGESLVSLVNNNASISELLPYATLVFFVGVTQYFSIRVMSGLRALPGSDDEDSDSEKDAEEAEIVSEKEDKSKDKESKVPEDLSFGDALQESMKNTMYIFPIMTAVISASFPAGLALYWTANSGFVIIQQIIVNWKKITQNFSEILTNFNLTQN